MIALILALLPAASGDWSQTYISQALQGDVSTAVAELAVEGGPALAPEDAALAARVRDRFGTAFTPAPAGSDPLLDGALTAFQRYWHARLTAGGSDEALESALMQELGRLLDRPASDDLLATLAEALDARGFHTRVGRTIPLLDIFVWRSQRRIDYEVELPEGSQPVTVVFMADFQSLGWSHYATFGRAYAGGWVGDDALYCIEADYDRRSEKFLVSYLKHEAQHFLDRQRFPEMSQTELEYRAKLVELIYAEETLTGLLASFEQQAAHDSPAPHAAANWQLVHDLRNTIAGCGGGCDVAAVPPATVKAAAGQLLRLGSER